MQLIVVTALLASSAPALCAQPAAAAAGPSIGDLPRRIVKDLRRVATRRPLESLVAGGALALASRPGDPHVVASVSGNRPLEEALDGGAWAGNGFVQVGGAAAAYGVGEWLHRPALASTGADLIEAQAVSGLMTQVVKIAVNRQRPDGGHYSFPSGHSSASFATATILARRLGWRYGCLAYAGAVYIATSRIADRRHYLSDVVFGASLGIAGGYAVGLASGPQRLSVRIVPVARGVMIGGALRVKGMK